MGEDPDFSVPISGGPYFSEFRVGGFLELVVDVVFVGGESGSDLEVGSIIGSGCFGEGCGF